MPTPFSRRRNRSHLLALEPRMMFDAAAAMVAQDAIADHDAAAHAIPDSAFDAHASDAAHHDLTVADRPLDTSAASASAPAREIVFIDSSVADYRQLAAEWAGRGEVVLIDGTRDGLDQVRAALAGQSDLAAIHIVSHGEQGAIWLGTTRLDATGIAGDLSASLGAVGRALAPGGDILIYGCDFAEGDAGARALAAFADATGADVAASTDTTGFAARGGDWTLEAHRGTVEARALSSGDWVHTLDPNTPVPIAVTADSLTVVNGAGVTVVSGTTGYGSDARSPDVGVGAVATWAGAATYRGHSVDLRATVVSISTGDAVRFNRPTGTGANGDDATFLLRDLTSGSTPAVLQMRWELVDHTSGDPLPADVRFTIADIDGIGGNPNTRETVTASTDHLAYYTRDKASDIHFNSTLSSIEASGTQDENNPVGATLTPKSAASFDWSDVSAFTLTYTLTPNAVTSQAQFYHDGDADFVYDNPVYVSIPRLDLDGNDSTAAGNDAHFTYTENGAGVPVVDADVVVSNPMDIDSIVGATVTLTNPKPGDVLSVGTLPANIGYTTATGAGGTLVVTFTGLGSESDYQAAFRAVRFANTSDAPDTTQRVMQVAFSNDTLTSASATSRIDVVAVNDAPVAMGTLPARAAVDAASVSYATAGAFGDPDGDALRYTATGLPAGLAINPATGVITGTLGRSASQAGGGRYAVAVTARDPSGLSETQGFTLTVTNPAPTARDDLATTAEDTPVRIAVLANDADPDGDPLTVTAATAGHGSVVRNADGTLTYTPDADYNGRDTIRYTIADGDGGTADAQVAVTITPVNDAPRAVPIPPRYTVADGTPIDLSITGAFGDIDGDALRYTATGLPAGVSLDAATGRLTGIVDRAASQSNGGVYAIVLTATDPSNATATQRVTLTVTNPAPAARDDSVTTAEDTPVRIAVLANDSDPDGDPLTVTAATASHGSVVRNADGTITYTPDADFNGTDTIRYTITDGEGGTADAQVAVTVTPVEDAPRATGTLPARSGVDAGTVAIATAPGFADADGDALTYAATGLPAGLAIDPATGVIAGTIDRSASQIGGGVYTVAVTASDPAGQSATQRFTFTVANPAPRASDDTATTREDTPVRIAVLANDSDPDGDPLTVTAATADHGRVAIAADGTLTYTPDADFNGTDTIHYTIADGEGGTAAATVAVVVTPVNDAPLARGTLPDQAARDGASVAYPTAAGFADVDGDTLSYSAAGLPAGLAIDPATGIIAGTLDRSASQATGGRYTVTVRATDGDGVTAVQRFTIAVTNPGPTATDDVATTHAGAPVMIAVLANDTDPDGDPLAVTGAVAARGSVAVLADGTLRYTPAAGFVGRDTIQYAISDGQGSTAEAEVVVDVTDAAPTAGPLPAAIARDGDTVALPTAAAFADADGDTLTYTATGLPPGLAIDPATGIVSGRIDGRASGANGGRYDATITATDPSGATASTTLHWTVTNPSPVAADDLATTAEDTPVTIAVLANDSDPDGDPLAVSAATADHGRVSANPNGTLSYTPDADFHGADTIRYTIADADGGTASASVVVTVTPVNDAPTTTGLPPRQTIAGAPVDVAVASAFRDADGDTLRFAATGLPAGLAIDPATGAITGTPAPGSARGGPAANGVYRVTVTATDPSGAGTAATFDWTIAPGAPIAADDGATTVEDTAVTIAVLANDRDPDGDPLTVTAATADHGSVAIGADGTLRYQPDRDFTGTDRIRYTIRDGSGATATATATVTVTPVNDAPVAADDTARTREDTAVAIPVLANDGDVDGDALTVTGATAAHGSVAIGADGTLTYRPAADFAGTDTIRYTVSDGQGGTTTALVAVTVDPVNDAPVIAGRGPIDAVGGRPVVIHALAGATDVDGDALTVTGATAANGSVVVNRDGTLAFTPALGFVGTTTVTYTVGDGHGGTATAMLVIRVADGRGADIAQLLRIGQVRFLNPPPPLATVALGADGVARNPLVLLDTAEAIRSLRTTAIGDRPLLDAVEAVATLRDTAIDAHGPITAEVARLDRLRDQRDAGDRLFDHRWGDFLVKGMTGFSAAADAQACVMIESVVRDRAIYVEVRDTAAGARAPIRAVDVRLANGARVPAWIRVDPRGLAIIERDAGTDELHLVVRVTRTDGRTTATPIVIQGETGEIELDRHRPAPARAAQPLDATLPSPAAAVAADAARLASLFE